MNSYSLKLQAKFTDRLWTFKSMSHTTAKLFEIGLASKNLVKTAADALLLFII